MQGPDQEIMAEVSLYWRINVVLIQFYVYAFYWPKATLLPNYRHHELLAASITIWGLHEAQDRTSKVELYPRI